MHNMDLFTDKPYLAGTKKHIRAHDIQVPDQMIDSAPQSNVICYLYVIDISPAFTPPEGNQNIEIFKNLFGTNNCYGILTTKALPRLGEMKFFQTFGAIKCSIKHTAVELKLDAEELRKLQMFHCILFRDVLNIWKSFFVLDSKNSFVIVPLNGQEISWNVVEQFQTWTEYRASTLSERARTVYNVEDWLHKVIWPWYRADQQTRYVVTKVHEHLRPNSEFPNESHATYAHYVMDKYGLEVYQSNQFLIEVKGITTHFNRLNPGEGEDGRKKVNDRGPEFLIPELCHNFKFPGDLWLKATVLPSILHRLFYLLHADNIRVKINKYVGVNIADYKPQHVIEKMNRRPTLYAKMGTHNSIIHPNPVETVPKELHQSDLTSMYKSSTCFWNESEEPVDLQRKFDQIYPFEIDYYHLFISKDFEKLSISDINASQREIYSNNIQPSALAICDVPPDEKIHINILDLNLTVPVARGVEQHDILAAITAASSSDVFDMERFEVIGDAFLKFGVSLYLLQTHVNWHEGHLTTIKGSIVSNRNLCYNAINMKLPGLIKIHNFNPKDDWEPPMVKVPDFVKVLTLVKF